MRVIRQTGANGGSLQKFVGALLPGSLVPMEKLMMRMAEGRDWFLAHLAVGPSDVSLGPDEWSLAQVIEHLVITERGVLAGMMRGKEPMPPTTPEREAQVAGYVALLRSGERYEVPSALVQPSEVPDLDSLLRDWEKVRGRLAGLLEKGEPSPGIQVIDHPIVGPLNAEESLEFLASHLDYHRQRVESMRDSPARS